MKEAEQEIENITKAEPASDANAPKVG